MKTMDTRFSWKYTMKTKAKMSFLYLSTMEHTIGNTGIPQHRFPYSIISPLRTVDVLPKSSVKYYYVLLLFGLDYIGKASFRDVGMRPILKGNFSKIAMFRQKSIPAFCEPRKKVHYISNHPSKEEKFSMDERVEGTYSTTQYK
jgi:hypothetical protein